AVRKGRAAHFPLRPRSPIPRNTALLPRLPSWSKLIGVTTPSTRGGAMDARLRSIVLRYLGAAVAVFLAWLVRWSLGPALGEHAPYVTFVGAVLITTWLSGLGPGLFALVLSVLVILYAFLPPQHSFLVNSPIQAIGVSLFVVVCSICIGVTEALRAMHEARAAA